MFNIEYKLIEILCVLQEKDFNALADVDIQKLLDLPIGEQNLDSLELMDFVMRIEEYYNLDLNERDVIKCKTIRQYKELIESQIVIAGEKSPVTRGNNN